MHYRKNLQKYTAFNLGFATSVVYQTLVPFFLTLIKLPQESDRRPYDSRGYWARSLIVVAISRRFPGLSGIWEQIGTQFYLVVLPRFRRRGSVPGLGGCPATVARRSGAIAFRDAGASEKVIRRRPIP